MGDLVSFGVFLLIAVVFFGDLVLVLYRLLTTSRRIAASRLPA